MKNTGGYWVLVEPIWDEISIYAGPKVFLDQFNAAPIASRTLFAAHWLQSEVRNGGFHQFFSNLTGVLAPEAVAAYEAIHMPKVAGLVRTAIGWFGETYPRDRGVREGRLDAYANKNPDGWNPFDSLDDEFFELIDKEHGGFVHAANLFAKR